MNSTIRTHLTAFCAILIVVVCMFHRLLLGDVIATNDLGGNDLLYYHYPMNTIYGEALKQGRLPEWSPYLYSGFPVFAEGQGGYLYPPNLILWGTLPPVAALNAYILLHALLLGLGMYFFVGKLTDNPVISIPSGVIASICGSVIAGHTRHLNVLAIIAMMPWLFTLAESFVRRGRRSTGAMFGLLLGMMILAGHPPHAFMAACYASGYLLLRRYLPMGKSMAPESAVKPISIGAMLAFFGMAIVVMLLVSLPQLIATQELSAFSRRLSEPATFENTIGSMPWYGFVSLFYPYVDGNVGTATFRQREVYMFWENFFYVSMVIGVLAIWGTVWGWKKYSAVRSLVILTGFFYLLALGDHFVLYGLYSKLPIVGAFRFPIRWFLIGELSMLALGGFGVMALLDFIKKKTAARKAPKTKTINPLPISLAVAAIAFCEIFLVAHRQIVTDPPAGYLAPSNFAVAARTSSLFGRMMSIAIGYTYDMAYSTHHGWETSRDLYKFGTALVPANLNATLHLSSVDGYNSLVPKYIYTLWGDSHSQGLFAQTTPLDDQTGVMQTSPAALKILRMWGVRFVSAPFQYPAPFTKIWDTTAFNGATLQGYELPGTFPRAWIVGSAVKVHPDSAVQAVLTMFDAGFDPAQQAVVNDTAFTMPADATNGSAEILKATDQSLTLRASVPGLVVVSDTWYPRWKATVNGVDAPVIRVNSSMRGIISPRSGSVIELRYDSGLLPVYCGIALIVLVLTTMYAWWDRKSKSTSATGK